MSDDTSFKFKLSSKEFVPMNMQNPEKTETGFYLELQEEDYPLPGTLHPCQEQHPHQNVYNPPSPQSVYTPQPHSPQQLFFAPSASGSDLSSSTLYYGEAASTPSTPSSLSAGAGAPSIDFAAIQLPLPDHTQRPNNLSGTNNISPQLWNPLISSASQTQKAIPMVSSPRQHTVLQLPLPDHPQRPNNLSASNNLSPQPWNPAVSSASETQQAMCNNPYFQMMLWMMQCGMAPPTNLFQQLNQRPNQTSQKKSTSPPASSTKGRNRGKNRNKRPQTPTMALRDQVEKMKEDVANLTMRLKLKKTDSSNDSFSSLLKLIELRYHRLKSERNQLKSANERHKKSQQEARRLRAEIKELKAALKKRNSKNEPKEKKENPL